MFARMILNKTTYAERELESLGYKVTSRTRESEVRLQREGQEEIVFTCACPVYPNIKALGCPLHHEGPGGSWPVVGAKELATEEG